VPAPADTAATAALGDAATASARAPRFCLRFHGTRVFTAREGEGAAGGAAAGEGVDAAAASTRASVAVTSHVALASLTGSTGGGAALLVPAPFDSPFGLPG
jgi:hypothetical protein